ncbi:MAG: helix-turn-helix transcriptional regulator [Alphaproteobacteria bacterium]|nr:helix-turn-helix transcriptional regulator [Alphaproteobacteria bacterium]
MQYEQVWDAVDKLARLHGLSPSGLAKKAGLDATTFNKSKRVRPDGKKRWPSLDSINKIINACNISFEQFYSLIDEELQPESLNSVPYIKFSELGNGINILNDEPQTDSWTRKNFPATTAGLYGIELDVDDYVPLYRKNSTIIAAKNAEICKGDRMVVFCKNNDILIKEFAHRTATTLVLSDIMDSRKTTEVNITDIALVSRIYWVSQ